MELAACFNLPLPGPKMIWQFGELGYDYSINTCSTRDLSEDCRVAPSRSGGTTGRGRPLPGLPSDVGPVRSQT